MAADFDWKSLEDPTERWDEPTWTPKKVQVSDAQARDVVGFEQNEATVARYEERCPKCSGTGRFMGYTGRVLGQCFKCQGKGTLMFKTSPETRAKGRESAAKAKARKAREKAQATERWIAEHKAVVDYMASRAGRWELMASFQNAVLKYGSLTERQLAVVERAMERDAQREAERRSSEPADGLDLSELPAGMYAVPGGDSRLKVRIDKPAKGKWAGWTFAKDGAVYGQQQRYGMQAPDGRYRGKIEEQLRVIAADPKAAMAEYGKLTGTCGACGRHLEDEKSIERGIGPVCAAKYGW